MDPPGRRDERVQQQERLQREEAYYHFINGLSEEEYRLMRDSNLLGTPGEVTAEELRQRLDGAKERRSSQPLSEPRSQSSETGDDDGGSGGVDAGREASNGDSLLEWLNTFRRTGNATRSGQSGNQTWRAVSRTNPNSGEFRFSLEININHEQPEPGDSTGDPASATLTHSTQSRRTQARRTRSSHGPALNPPPPAPEPEQHSTSLSRVTALDQPAVLPHGGQGSDTRSPPRVAREGQDCPPSMLAQPGQQRALPCRSRTRLRGRGHRTGGAHRRSSRRSRSPLHRPPTPGTSQADIPEPYGQAQVAMDMAGEPAVDVAPLTEPVTEAESQATGTVGGGVRRHPTIMLDLQVRRIRPGENRDRDSIASRTRSRVRTAENTVTFESDSGGFRRTISRSERAGIRTYVSTIRIPLRRISETGLGEPSSTALRSILRQIMTGFGELSSLMETEADTVATVPGPPQAYRMHTEETGHQEQRSAEGQGTAGGSGDEERTRVGGATGETRVTTRDTNNLVENGTLPILRLAHFFLLNEEEEDEHPHGLTKEQIDDLSTRTYGQASLEGELGRTCSVCINEYTQGNKLRQLPCTHEFHIHCIDRWLSQNNTCPICRQPILATDPTLST
ncbi:E3 ubiquitin-protein ligase RNF6 [Conger conger]|nr:E3 ubiquitin-protein ligase RNF6 [Conger conger]XP_061093875.1 E3 ubiquitin-protein ligase RNF6 [Conger conger]